MTQGDADLEAVEAINVVRTLEEIHQLYRKYGVDNSGGSRMNGLMYA